MRFPSNSLPFAVMVTLFLVTMTSSANDDTNTGLPPEKGKPASALDMVEIEERTTTSPPKKVAKPPAKPAKPPAPKKTTPPPPVKRPPVPPSPKREKCTCGLKPEDGDEAGIRPWHCEIQIATKDGSVTCAGTLIDSQWVLTAASCAIHAPKLDRKTGVTVTCGNRTTKSAKNNLNVKVDRVSLHDEYSHSKTQVHNIALLHLAKALILEDGTLPACLPFKDNALGCVSKIGVTVSTTFMEFKDGAQNFQTKEMDCLPSIECNPVMKNGFKVTKDMLCTQQNEMSCPDKGGNSGGGILYHAAKDDVPRSYVIGVNTFGPNCLEAATPGVNMYVYRYLDWISEKTMGAQLCDEAVVFSR